MRDGNIGGILSRTTTDGPAFYGYDGNGNVTLLTNSAGQDVGHYRYDAFGNTLEATGPRAAENPYRFSTKELHGPSGLYDYGLRFYSPGMGRWLNRDPLEEEGGINLYGFVGNNPINDVDEYGLNPYIFGGPVRIDQGGSGDLDHILRNIEREEQVKGGSSLPLSDFDKMMAKRMEGVNPWMDGSAAPIGSPMHGMGAVGAAAAPFAGTGPKGYYRPSGVPKTWIAQPAKRGVGKTWVKPNTKVPGETYVRVMKGTPNHPHPNSRKPYVRMQKNGHPLDGNGNKLSSANDSRAHIPRSGFKVNPKWFD